MKQLKKILPVQNGYYLEDDGYDGFLSVVIPLENDNLVLNPIMNDYNEDNKPDNWLIPDGGVNPIAYYKHEGGPFWTHFYRYCWPLAGGTISALVDGTIEGTYSASVWAKSETGGTFIIKVYYIASMVGIRKESIEITASNVWQQYSFTFKTDGFPGSSIQLEISGTNIECLDVAGVQLEKGPYPTTMIHGYNGEGYAWLGTPFASISRRESTVTDGGRRVNLKDLGMRLTNIQGIGLPDIDHSTTELAFNYGSKFNGITIKERDYEMEFVLHSLSLKDLLCSRNAVGRAIFTLNQPRTFIWQPLDCGVPVCEEVQFNAVYKSGFSLGLNSLYGEEIKLSFTGYDVPMRASTQVTTELASTSPVTHYGMVGIDENGNYNLLASPSAISANIYRTRGMVISPYDGNLYALVDSGTVEATCQALIIKYDGVSWTLIAKAAITSSGLTFDGPGASIYAHQNYLYIGTTKRQLVVAQGSFFGTSGLGMARINLASKVVEDIGSLNNVNRTQADGVTAQTPVIRAWMADARGSVYAAGNFTGTTGGLYNSLSAYDIMRLYKVNNTGLWTWDALGIDLSLNYGGINALYYDAPEQRLYVGGDTWKSTGISAANSYNVFFYLNFAGVALRTDFPLTSASLPGKVNCITKYKNRIILGGRFRASYALDVDILDHLAFFDDSVFSSVNVFGQIKFFNAGMTYGWAINDAYAIATGLSTVDPVESFAVCDGVLHIVGKMSSFAIRTSASTFYVPSITACCGAVEYVSTADTAEIGVMTPSESFGYGSPITLNVCNVEHVICGSERLRLKRIYAQYLQTAQVTTMTSYFNDATNVPICDTDLPVSPKFILRGPAKLSSIENQTYGFALFFDYYLESLEYVVVDLTTSPPRVISNVNGDITNKMLAASTPGTFKLYPGDNYIIIDATYETITSNTLFAIQYTRNALSAEALCCDCPE